MLEGDLHFSVRVKSLSFLCRFCLLAFVSGSKWPTHKISNLSQLSIFSEFQFQISEGVGFSWNLSHSSLRDECALLLQYPNGYREWSWAVLVLKDICFIMFLPFFPTILYWDTFPTWTDSLRGGGEGVLWLLVLGQYKALLGFPGGTSWQCRRLKRCGFNPWVGNIPWSRKQQSTPVFLPGESPWTEDPGRLQSIGSHRVRDSWSYLACTHTQSPLDTIL